MYLGILSFQQYCSKKKNRDVLEVELSSRGEVVSSSILVTALGSSLKKEEANRYEKWLNGLLDEKNMKYDHMNLKVKIAMLKADSETKEEPRNSELDIDISKFFKPQGQYELSKLDKE